MYALPRSLTLIVIPQLLCLAASLNARADGQQTPTLNDLRNLTAQLQLELNGGSVSRYFDKPDNLRRVFSSSLSRPGFRGDYHLQVEPTGQLSVYYGGGYLPGGKRAYANTYRNDRWVNQGGRASRTKPISGHEAEYRVEVFVSRVFRLPSPQRPVWGRMTSRSPNKLFVNDNNLSKPAIASRGNGIKWVRLDRVPANVNGLYLSVNRSVENLPQMLVNAAQTKTLECEIYPRDKSSHLDFGWLSEFNQLEQFHLETSLQINRESWGQLFTAMPKVSKLTLPTTVPASNDSGPSEFLPLSSNEQLQKLVVRGSMSQQDLTAIASIKNLQQLGVKFTADSYVSDFDWLAQLKKLRQVSLFADKELSADELNRLLGNLGPDVAKLFLFIDLQPGTGEEVRGFQGLSDRKSLRSVALQGTIRDQDLKQAVSLNHLGTFSFQGRETRTSKVEQKKATVQHHSQIADSPLLLKWQMKFGVHTLNSLAGTQRVSAAKAVLDQLVADQQREVGDAADLSKKRERVRELTKAVMELSRDLKIHDLEAPRRRRRYQGGFNPIGRMANDDADGMGRRLLVHYIETYEDERDRLSREVGEQERKLRAKPISRTSVVSLPPTRTPFKIPAQKMTQSELAVEIVSLATKVQEQLTDPSAVRTEVERIVALDGRANLVGLQLGTGVKGNDPIPLEIEAKVSLDENQDTEVISKRRDGLLSVRKAVRFSPTTDTSRLVQATVCLRVR